jgi:hypothetical protein
MSPADMYDFDHSAELVSEKPKKFRLTEDKRDLIPKAVARYLQGGGRFEQ